VVTALVRSRRRRWITPDEPFFPCPRAEMGRLPYRPLHVNRRYELVTRAISAWGGFARHQENRRMILTYEFLANWLRARFGDSERGASLVEYALLVALIAVVCIAAVTILGKNASNKFNSVGSSIG
jgi:pilus assembly protein Flp/PilA